MKKDDFDPKFKKDTLAKYNDQHGTDKDKFANRLASLILGCTFSAHAYWESSRYGKRVPFKLILATIGLFSGYSLPLFYRMYK